MQYNILQASGGNKDSGHMIVPVKTECIFLTLRIGKLAVCYHVSHSSLCPKETHGAAAQPRQRFVPHSHWIPCSATQEIPGLPNQLLSFNVAECLPGSGDKHPISLVQLGWFSLE